MSTTNHTRRGFLGLLAGMAVAPLGARAATDDAISRFHAIDERFAVSAADLSAAIERAGQAAADANVSFGTLVDQVKVAKEVTGRSADVIGNALNTIYTRLQRAETLEILRDAGVKVRWTVPTQSGDDILRGVAARWPHLSSAQRRVITEQLGGVYQINVIRAIFT